MAEALAEMTDLGGQPDVVPEGFGTKGEWAELLGLKESQTYRTLKDGVESNPPLFEKREFRIKRSNSGLFKTPHWRWIPKAERL